MKPGSFRIFNRTNTFLILYLMLCWISADRAFQFSSIALIEDNFPGNHEQWLDNGVSENTLLDQSGISVIPVHKKHTRLAKRYILQRNNSLNQYIKIESKITSRIIAEPEPEINNYNGKVEDSLFYLWFENEFDKKIKVALLADLVQSNQEIQTSSVVPIHEDAAFVNIGFLLRQFQTTHTLLALEVQLLERSQEYKIAILILLLLPLIGLCFLCSHRAKTMSKLPVLLLAGVLIFFIAGVLLPGNFLNIILSPFTRALTRPDTLTQAIHIKNYLDILHFLGFAILTIIALSYCSVFQLSKTDAIFKVWLFTAFTEIIQRHSLERTPSLFDLLVDSGGIIVGTGIWFLVNLIFMRRN